LNYLFKKRNNGIIKFCKNNKYNIHR
jgi:hypothetical protein